MRFVEVPVKLCPLLILFIVLVQNIGETRTLVEIARAKRRSNFDDKIIPSTRKLWDKKERHQTFCVGECGRDASCVSAFFNKITGDCQGHSVTFSDAGDAGDQPNTRLYVLPRGEGYIGDECEDVSDCITPHAQCFNGTCMCIHGYSLKPTTYECLQDVFKEVHVEGFAETSNKNSIEPNLQTEDCTVYGDDFMEVRNHYISGENQETFEQYSISDCMSTCRNRTQYICRSLEYQWSVEKCFLTNVTTVHHPDRWYEDGKNEFNISYFQRDCEQ